MDLKSLRKPAAAVVLLAALSLTGCSDKPKITTDVVPQGAMKATLSIDLAQSKKISDMLFGVFFEDINYGADGGLYAELIRNRDFEFSPAAGDKAEWNNKTAWTLKGEGTTFEISESNPISKNNKNYAILSTTAPGAQLINEGFQGICIKKGAKYDFSVFAKNLGSDDQTLEVMLIDKTGANLGSAQIDVSAAMWKTLDAVIVANADCDDAQFAVIPQKAGKIGLDMVSLFPQNTFKGRKNGLRKDLAQAIADLKPAFVRFPGGCITHGDLPIIDGKIHSGLVPGQRGIHDVYYWYESVGKLEDRTPIRNRWGYHQTRGLGYFEYFQFCEDIGAEPLPIIACGVDCQYGERPEAEAVPLDEMKYIVQHAIDLVEFANGDVTTKWGKVRADMGHAKPFNLKYVGIGNEEKMSSEFEVRFKMVFDEMKKVHPEIKVVGTVGPTADGDDFERGWAFGRKEGVHIIDEHFYREPKWFVEQGFHRYDNYDRKGPKVYAGEYAAHENVPEGTNRRNTVETAMHEAIFLAGVERNGDIVTMSSYAPLVNKIGDTQWYPDMIPFTNKEVKKTTTYEVQKLYGNNTGSVYIDNKIAFDNAPDDFESKMVSSVVRDDKGDIIIKLVNVTDKAFDFKVDLGNISGKVGGVASRTILAGPTWTGTEYTLNNDFIKAGKSFSVVCQPQSMSLIRIPGK